MPMTAEETAGSRFNPRVRHMIVRIGVTKGGGWVGDLPILGLQAVFLSSNGDSCHRTTKLILADWA